MDDSLQPMDEGKVKDYMSLAGALPNIDSRFVVGWPWAQRPELEPLLERFHAWKMGIGASGILYPIESSEHLLELLHAYAELRGVSVNDVFSGGVFMLSPLRLTYEEASQFVWWWRKGYRPCISHMSTSGMTGPVTPSGMVTLHLAEMLAIGLVNKACFGTTSLSADAMIAPADMKTLMRPYGRPDMSKANILFAQMADYYELPCFLHSGLTDAYRPSTEAGYQKASSTMTALFSGAAAMLEAGLLGGDRIYSPLQMILDNEFAGALKHLIGPCDCSDEAIGVDTILEAGHGGVYTWLEHTVARYREELWEPAVWTRTPPEACPDLTIDVERAKDVYHTMRHEAEPVEHMTPEEEQTLLDVIMK